MIELASGIVEDAIKQNLDAVDGIAKRLPMMMLGRIWCQIAI